VSSRTLLSGSLVLSLDFFSGEFDGTMSRVLLPIPQLNVVASLGITSHLRVLRSMKVGVLASLIDCQ